MHRRRSQKGGAHLVVDDMWGETRWSDEVVIGKWGSQKGLVLDPDDLDEPGVDDMPRPRVRKIPSVGPWTGPETITEE